MIAGAGFAVMAWKEAQRRTHFSVMSTPQICPGLAGIAERNTQCPHCEYGHILANAARGFAGIQVARRLHMLSDRPTVGL